MLKLITYKKTYLKEVEDQLKDPINRKRSSNMLLAQSAIEKVMNSLSTELDAPISMYICSGEGELKQTCKFYQNLAINQKASPTLFQNSLHSSTMGAISLSSPLIEQGSTISNGVLSIESAIDLALNIHDKEYILIVGVDVYPEELTDFKSKYYGKSVSLVSAASAALFTNNKEHSLYKDNPLPALKDINFKYSNNHSSESFDNFFAANGLDSLYALIQNETTEPFININKPNGSIATYALAHE